MQFLNFNLTVKLCWSGVIGWKMRNKKNFELATNLLVSTFWGQIFVFQVRYMKPWLQLGFLSPLKWRGQILASLTFWSQKWHISRKIQVPLCQKICSLSQRLQIFYPATRTVGHFSSDFIEIHIVKQVQMDLQGVPCPRHYNPRFVYFLPTF